MDPPLTAAWRGPSNFNLISAFPSLSTSISQALNRQRSIMETVTPPSFPQAEPADPSFKPQEISFSLPKALHTTAHVHLTFLDNCAMVFLATSTPGDSGGTVKPLGSFVYAMPDVSFHLDVFPYICAFIWLSIPIHDHRAS